LTIPAVASFVMSQTTAADGWPGEVQVAMFTFQTAGARLK